MRGDTILEAVIRVTFSKPLRHTHGWCVRRTATIIHTDGGVLIISRSTTRARRYECKCILTVFYVACMLLCMSDERDCGFQRVDGRQIRSTASEWRMQKAEPRRARERPAATNLRMSPELNDAMERTGGLEVERFRAPLPCGTNSQGTR
jgi:hypothetical protein